MFKQPFKTHGQKCLKAVRDNYEIKRTYHEKTIVFLITSSLVAFVLLTGCNSPNKKVEDTKSVVLEANKELQQANLELTADINQYRRETADRIAANDSMITAFKANIANETADVKAATEKQLAALEQKNSDLKKKLADYKGEGKENWETFKTAFNRDMNTLGEALKNLTDTNS